MRDVDGGVAGGFAGFFVRLLGLERGWETRFWGMELLLGWIEECGWYVCEDGRLVARGAVGVCGVCEYGDWCFFFS